MSKNIYFVKPGSRHCGVALTSWISLFGVPSEILFNEDRNFESALFHDVSKIFDLEKTRTTPLFSSDFMVERMNKTINGHVLSLGLGWWTAPISTAYGPSMHETTRNAFASGRELRVACDLKFGYKSNKMLVEHAKSLCFTTKWTPFTTGSVGTTKGIDRIKNLHDVCLSMPRVSPKLQCS